jgi:hypothetical protein
LFRHKFISDAMIFVILLSLLVHVSMTIVSNSSRRVFSGIVYASSGVPISRAYIWASGSEGYGSNVTDSFGQYSITEGLSPGNYTVTASAYGYLEGEVENVEVTAGQETSNINFYLSLSGGISGQVTDAVSGLPLQNIRIHAENATSGTYVAGGYTDANGDYLIVENLATGTYNVTASDPEGHLDKTVSGIAVTAGVEVKGVNLALKRSGIISGKVTDAVSGLPLQSIVIRAQNATGGTLFGGQYATTNASGNYRINMNLATGTYNVTAWFPEGHLDKTVSGIAVTAGVEVTVDLALTPSGIISGRVTATSGGAPLAGASVVAMSESYMGGATTNATGYYKILSGLGNGTYMVMASYSEQYGQVMGVDVVEGSETPNVNIGIDVEPSGIITGKVTDTSSEPITSALVMAQGTAGSGEAYTDVNGSYVISSGLGTGTYTVNASAHGYSTQTTGSVSVTVGQVTNVDFQLPKLPPEQLGTISGIVEGDANPIPEFQHPIVILLIVTSVAFVLIKLSNVKARRKKPQESTVYLVHGAKKHST